MDTHKRILPDRRTNRLNRSISTAEIISQFKKSPSLLTNVSFIIIDLFHIIIDLCLLIVDLLQIIIDMR
jgi:hypothetical protein